LVVVVNVRAVIANLNVVKITMVKLIVGCNVLIPKDIHISTFYPPFTCQMDLLEYNFSRNT